MSTNVTETVKGNCSGVPIYRMKLTLIIGSVSAGIFKYP